MVLILISSVCDNEELMMATKLKKFLCFWAKFDPQKSNSNNCHLYCVFKFFVNFYELFLLLFEKFVFFSERPILFCKQNLIGPLVPWL